MTWHVEVVDADDFLVSITTIRRTGGTITSCCPCSEGYQLTFVTVD
jgi:hypothetical protein